MSKVEDFLSKEEEQEIVLAIRQAEQNTSGEIRIHIEASSNKEDAFKHALNVFQSLKMFETKQRNAVLIYVAVEDHQFVIYGDEGINKVVPDYFWDTTKNIMQNHFKKGAFKQGIVEGILKAGEELKTHFRWQNDEQDELSNEISKG